MPKTRKPPSTLGTGALPGLVSPTDLATDRQFSMSLSRGLDVLRAFAPDRPALGNQEIVERTGLPRSTVSRLTYTLVMLGYLARDESSRKYRLSAGVLSLAHPMLAGLQVRQVARRFMAPLALRTRCTVNLAIRDRLDAVYIDSCRPDSGNPYLPDIGSTRPLLNSSIGRALILASPRSTATAILNCLKVADPASFARSQPIWIRDAKHFAQRGFCVSTGDWQQDMHAVAAPILTAHRGQAVAINCTISARRLRSKSELVGAIAPLMLETVRQIEDALGVAGDAASPRRFSR